jgi:hypothetical protein
MQLSSGSRVPLTIRRDRGCCGSKHGGGYLLFLEDAGRAAAIEPSQTARSLQLGSGTPRAAPMSSDASFVGWTVRWTSGNGMSRPGRSPATLARMSRGLSSKPMVQRFSMNPPSVGAGVSSWTCPPELAADPRRMFHVLRVIVQTKPKHDIRSAAASQHCHVKRGVSEWTIDAEQR